MNEERILVEEIVKHTDYTARILITLATVGIATDGQLARLCLELTNGESYYLRLSKQVEERRRELLSEAERMLKTEGYVARERDVRLPKQMGGSVVNAWYLTGKGVAAATLIDPYFTKYAAPGMPCGTKRDRIPHELAVTECLLKLTEKQIICDFIPERELKSRLLKRRHELLKQGINPKWHKETAGEETGDFKAVLLPKDDPESAKFTVEGEAAINYRRAQIEAKPDKMVWFVTSKTQKEMVLATRKETLRTIWILGGVNEPFKEKKPELPSTNRKNGGVKRNALERKTDDFLRQRNEIYTGRALACLLKEDVGNISRVLAKLNKQTILMAEEIKLTPARFRGRPNKLFWHVKADENVGHSRADRIRALVISETICFFAKYDYRFVQYTQMIRQAEFVPHDRTKNNRLRVVIESPELHKDELRKWIEMANEGAQPSKVEVVIAVSTRDRYEEINELIRRNTVLLIEGKSVIKPQRNAGERT